MAKEAGPFRPLYLELKLLSVRHALPVFDAGVSVVVVDTLVVFRFDVVPRDLRMSIEFERHVADEVFHKNGVLISPLRDRFFVLAFQQRVQLAAGLTFNDRNQIFDPNSAARTNLYGHDAALIMRPVSGDRLRARAER